MMTSAVLAGRRSPFQGQAYGVEAFVAGLAAPREGGGGVAAERQRETPSSIGAPWMARRGEQVTTRITSVST